MNITISKVILLLLLLNAVPAAGAPVQVSRAGLKAHYPDNNVFAMYKDSKDIVWFATMFGLIMFDGSNYFRFKYDPSDSSSISNDDVISVFEDSKGFLWFGTYYGGLNRYDRRTGAFTRYLAERKQISDNTVWCLTEDKKGVLWAGTQNGLNRFDGSKWETVELANGDSSSGKIYTLAVDDADNLYAGTLGSGLAVLGSNRNEARFFNLRNADKHSLNANYIRSSVTIPGKGVLIGTLKKGAYILGNKQISDGSFTFRSIAVPDMDRDDHQSLSVFDAETSYGNSVLLGTSSGIYSYEANSDTLRPFAAESPDGDRHDIVSILQPGNGVVLASYYDEGLFEYHDNSNKILTEIRHDEEMNPAGSIRKFADLNGRIIAVGRKGLFELKNGKLAATESGKAAKGKDILTAATADDGRLWLGLHGGILVTDGEGNLKKQILMPEGVSVTELAYDGSGSMYAGTTAGIKVIDVSSGSVVREYKHNPEDASSLSESMILSLYIDPDGNLWAGTYAGLNMLKRGTDKFERFRKITGDTASLINNYVYSILWHAGKIYLGTAGGLSIYDGTNFSNFTSADGLSDQAVNSLASYGGKIITGSNFNIQVFDPVQRTFSPEARFDDILNPSSIAKEGDGVFYFGGRNGIIEFNISGMTKPASERKFIFTRAAFEQDGSRHIADLTSTKELKLEHNPVNIEISFSDLDYSSDGSSAYYYRISGIDKGWNFSGGNSSITLKTLDAGTYEIVVKVAEPGGSSYESPISLKIIVAPPFYQTLPFYIICTALLAATAYGAHRVNANRKVRRALEIEHAREEEREKIRYEASRDYHDELGHKLTRISIYSRNLLREIEAQKASISKELHKIMETSASLKESARDLIWSMDPGEDTLYDLAVRIKDFAENLLHEKGIGLQASGISESMKTVYLGMDVKRNLLLIAKEAVNNSVKYSEASQMKIEFGSLHDPFTMKLTDDGIGFDEDAGREGFGIRSMKARAARIGAAILISGRSGNGTSVEVSLDLRKGIKEFSLN
ncbi:MAG: hypothetical protein K1X85_02410 [Ignavibacteria bacterium]|nr:hypothetical protein [Ignavibacteria bacterium]